MGFPRSLTIGFFILLSIFWATLADEGLSARDGAKTNSLAHNYALIIGINNYDNWPKLKSPVSDAEAIAAILSEKYDFKKANIALLTDKTREKPTLVNVYTRLDRYVRSLKPEDNLLIYFSGHSTEDDEGETFWIPIDGKQKSKLTWLSHKSLSEEVFSSADFKIKNLCVISDSLFSNKLLRKRSISLTPFDLRYEEKITEKASLPSREVISFGDHHWPGSAKTNGMGLFAYYIYKALKENPLDVIDFENLVFDENIIFPITKIAGTKLVRGRLKTPIDQGGQFVVAKVTPAPVIDILETEVAPKKGYPGDGFTVSVKTSLPAEDVYLEVGSDKYPMTGKGTDWTYRIDIEKIGKTPFRVAALNRNDIEGKSLRGEIITIKRRAKPTNVTEATVTPAAGLGGDSFRFTARTDLPAKEVVLEIGGKPYGMSGSGTEWSLDRVIDDPGQIEFSVAAINADGVQGKTETGRVRIKPGIANVINLEAAPKTGFAGEEFTITARTDRVAAAVSLTIDGKNYPMEGDGRSWRLKRKIEDIGKKQFSAIAKNTDGAAGKSVSGELLAKKTPLPIPDVASVKVNTVSPGKGYAGDSFQIAARTSAPSSTVVLEIEGKKLPMQGKGTEWTTTAKIDKIGISKYVVVAKNRDGMQGQSREGEINAPKRPAAPVNILNAQVTPAQGYIGRKFNFKAQTDRPAASVTMLIGNKPFDMKGSGTNWTLDHTIEVSGELEYTVVAKNEDQAEGRSKTAYLMVFKERYRLNDDGTLTDVISGEIKKRFVDNGDGTITDLAYNLMWLKQPKQIALNWDDAVEYCRDLKFRGLEGWRLPTIGELKGLTDNTKKNPALPAGNPFENVITHVGYWSKSKHKFGPTYVYQMSLWFGKASHLKKTENAIVWPVRYAE